jgi:hypothetical protein
MSREILTAVPMFQVGATVRVKVIRMTRHGNRPGKRLVEGTFTVASVDRYDSYYGFVYTLTSPTKTTRQAGQEYLVRA